MNKDAAEKIHELLKDIEDKQIQSMRRFKRRKLPLIIIITVLIVIAFLLIYPRIMAKIETLIDIMEQFEQITPNGDTNKIWVKYFESKDFYCKSFNHSLIHSSAFSSFILYQLSCSCLSVVFIEELSI